MIAPFKKYIKRVVKEILCDHEWPLTTGFYSDKHPRSGPCIKCGKK